MPDGLQAGRIIHHDEHLLDRAVMLAMRAVLKVQPAPVFGPEARSATDTMMANVPAADGVTYEPAVIAGVQGWWCRPASARSNDAILHLHGGAYVVGSAWAYRHFIGQIAARAGAAAFVPDYGLAPERPFPAGLDDAIGIYRELSTQHAAIAVAGDSAGGGLALGLLSQVCAAADEAFRRPACGVLMSPWADLSLSGDSMDTRAARDPLLSRNALAGAAALYLGDIDPRDPRASALFGDLGRLPPMLLHVGEDEVLLDDTIRIATGLADAGREVEAHVWAGMAHVFPASVGKLRAADEALAGIGDFIRASFDHGRRVS